MSIWQLELNEAPAVKVLLAVAPIAKLQANAHIAKIILFFISSLMLCTLILSNDFGKARVLFLLDNEIEQKCENPCEGDFLSLNSLNLWFVAFNG